MSLLRAMEREFRSRSESGDDSEVTSYLTTQADHAATEADMLLDLAAGDIAEGESGGWLLRLPIAIAPARVVEEQTMFSLIFAFSALNAKRASFAVLLQLIKDSVLQQNLSEASGKASEAAAFAFHLLPTRSKIAFNMLTPNEIDPSVETRAATARLT